MDKIDTKLLKELMKDSRIPLTILAKKIKVSREVLNYRLHKLIKEGVIINFVTEIDVQKLGFVGVAVFVKVKSSAEKEFQEYLKNCHFISWVAELSGVWSFGFSIYGRSNSELDQKMSLILAKFKSSILEHRFTLHRKSIYFYENYFGMPPTFGKKEKVSFNKSNPDETDKIILREISKNSRLDCVKLSQIVGLTPPAISKRIKSLKKQGIIQKYSLFIDLSKLGLFQYSILLINKNAENKGKLLAYFSKHPKISFLAEYVGDPFLEIGIVVDNPYKLRPILQQLEEAFPENRVMEVSLFQKEFISVGPPPCVFEEK